METNKPTEPWWIKDEREFIAHVKRIIEGKPDNEGVFYIGDQRGLEPVSKVRKMLAEREARIKTDIARFQAAGGDYEKM